MGRLCGIETGELHAEELWLDSYLAQIRAAEQGLGMALGLRPIVNPWLQQRRVVAPWPLQVRIPQCYYLLHRPDDGDRPEIVAFRDWVVEQLAGFG